MTFLSGCKALVSICVQAGHVVKEAEAGRRGLLPTVAISLAGLIGVR